MVIFPFASYTIFPYVCYLNDVTRFLERIPQGTETQGQLLFYAEGELMMRFYFWGMRHGKASEQQRNAETKGAAFVRLC